MKNINRMHVSLPSTGWEGKSHEVMDRFLGRPVPQTIPGKIYDPEGTYTIRAAGVGKLGMYMRMKREWERNNEFSTTEEHTKAMKAIADSLGV